MSVDLRTEINDADGSSGHWATDGGFSPQATTRAGEFYEGTGGIATRFTNTAASLYAVNDTAGSTFSIDFSDVTVYVLVKNNLVDTYANGGAQVVLHDGTDRIGYDVAGLDAPGMPLEPYYNSFKLDCSESAATPGGHHVFAGSEANLTYTAITGVGYGALHLAKAQGNVFNTWSDRVTYIANGSYALRINGGTVGTPETMADVQGDDETNGWGVVNNPLGSQYGFFAPTEWGEPAANADVYFSATNEQWYWIGDNQGGRAVGATHFPFRVVGNATDTISFVLDNVVIVNTGTRAQFDMSDADVDTLDLTAVSFTDLGAITFPADATGKVGASLIFNNCDQVYFEDFILDIATFNGSNDALGAVLWDENSDPSNQDNLTFNSDGTGHAIHVDLTGDGPGAGGEFTFNISGYTVSGYETTSGGSTGNTVFLVDNNNDNDVTINVTDGSGTFSYEKAAGYTGTVTVNQTVTVTITVVDTAGDPIEGAAVFLEETPGGTDVISYDLTDVNGEVSVSYTGTTPQAVTGFVRKGTKSPVYKASPINDTISSTGLNAVITLVSDE
jgi:hypothetical protein